MLKKYQIAICKTNLIDNLKIKYCKNFRLLTIKYKYKINVLVNFSNG